MSSKLMMSMSTGAAVLPIDVSTVLDRTLLLRVGRLSCLPTHSAVCSLQTALRQEDWQSWRSSQPRVTSPAVALRPRFVRPSRAVKVQQLRAQAAEACSLNFDAVDPFQQEGMTRRMLVFFKSLEDLQSYWEGEKHCKEHAFQLLVVSDAGMAAIRSAITCAAEFIDGRCYRCGYNELCGVRHWLIPASADAVITSEPGAIVSTAVLDNIVPLIQQDFSEQDAYSHSSPEVRKAANDDSADQDACDKGSASLSKSAALAHALSAALPVKNTFIHFNMYPALPRRCRSMPSSPAPRAWEADAPEGNSSDKRAHHGHLILSEGFADMSETCTQSCASSLGTKYPLPAKWQDDITIVSTCDEKSPRSEVSIPSTALAEGEERLQEEAMSSQPDCLIQTPARSEVNYGQARVRNTFIHLDDEDDKDSVAGHVPKRSSSAPASCSYVDRIRRVPAAEEEHTQHKKQRNRRHNGRGKKKSSALEESDGIEDHGSHVLTEQSSVQECGGFFRVDWVESAEKISGNLRLLMRRIALPAGDFTLTLCPQGSTPVHGRNGGPSFRDTMGHSLCYVRCDSKKAPDVILAFSLGKNSKCPGTQHDFSKKQVFKVPKVLDLWSAIDTCTGSFTLTCTVIARA
eukprot:TRINITY_DN26111_c0_g1_i1.p1 TRINITY_DN26111_c0_g1~~TRINITY_DN26111_c0_g1_i1.p1  ORF type:complete len:629 (-),score=108.12 TRINITY_DN26111_c0_g1_i1:186-2072(-)